MKILIHSNAPWCPSGYGQQTAYLAPRLRSLGHEVAISCFHGLQGGPITWNDFYCYPVGQHPYGGDVVGLHATHFGADLVLTVMDIWALPTDTLNGIKTASWMPVDAEPLGMHDVRRLQGKKDLIPIAMTRFGEKMLNESGFSNVLYVPHGIDTKLFRPPEDRDAMRKAMGLDGKFVIFINAANFDKFRKGYSEQFNAFARLHAKHPDDTVLNVHALDNSPSGIDLRVLASRLGIEDAVKFSSQYWMTCGLVTPEMVRGSYGAADLYSACSLAEGFCLPLVEAMSCGTLAVTTDGSAMNEVGGPCWKVRSEPFYIPGHDSWWRKPLLDEITRVYERAYAGGPTVTARREKMREHALNYDVDLVFERYWVPALQRIEAT